MVQAGMKAGLIGGVIAVVLALMGQIPCLGALIACFSCFGTLLLWIGVGAWAVSMGGEEIKTVREGAGAGALAGAVAAVIGGVANIVIGLARAAIFGATAAAGALAQIPPEAWQALKDVGIQPSLLVRWTTWTTGFGGALIGGSLCCLTGIVIAVVLGGLGGLIWKAMKAS